MADNINLLFRRGAMADLKNAAIVPGAISITTDEPGLYLDLAGTEAGADGVAKRIRLGDIITVQNIAELQAKAINGDPFHEQALYYSIDENMLMKYVKDDNEFKLINDQSELIERVGTLEDEDVAIKADIAALEKGLEDEIDAREGAVENLQKQINTITGVDGETTSLAGLKAALDAEILARTNADNTHDTNIAANSALANANKQDITNLKTLVGTLPAGETRNIVTYLSDKITAEENRAKQAESTQLEKINKNIEDIGDLNDELASESARAKAAEQTNANAAAAAATAAQEAKDLVAEEKSRAEGIEKNLSDAIDVEKGRITTLNQTVADNKSDVDAKISTINTTLSSVKELAEANESAIDANKVDAENKFSAINTEISEFKTEVEENFETVDNNIAAASAAAAAVQTNLTEEISRATQAEQALGTRIDGVSDRITQEVNDRAAEITRIEKDIESKGNAIAQNTADIGNLKGRMQQAEADIDALTDLNTALNTALQNEAQIARAAEQANATAIANEKQRAEGAEATLSSKIDAETTARGTAIANALAEAKTHAETKDAALLELINENIAAANAMTFKETEIKSYNDLPTTDVHGGDTYVVTSRFDGKEVGDLLIAKRDQTAADDLSTTAARRDFFIHVATGYSTFNDAKLAVNSQTGQIELQSHLNEVLGTIAVNSASENIITYISGTGSNGIINVNFVWSTF